MRVGFIGLGNIGGPMAMRVVRGGYQVAVFDIRRDAADPHLQAGAAWAGSPSELAGQSDVIMVSVPGPAEIEQLMFGPQGVIHTIKAGSVYVELSTTLPSNMRHIHDALKRKGADAIDSPVSGGANGAERGQLAAWVGGEEQVFQRVRPILSTFADKITYIGDIGSGLTAKLVHNQLLYTTVSAIAESFAMGIKSGLSSEVLLKVVRDGAYGKIFSMLPKTVTSGDFKWSQFGPGHIIRKDQTIANQFARELDVVQPLANLVEQQMIETIRLPKKTEPT